MDRLHGSENCKWFLIGKDSSWAKVAKFDLM